MSDFIESKWISIKDRLPDKDGKYLCVWDGIISSKGIEIFRFAKNLKKIDKYDFPKAKAGWYDYDSDFGYMAIKGATHWMPLPELPKEQ